MDFSRENLNPHRGTDETGEFNDAATKHNEVTPEQTSAFASLDDPLPTLTRLNESVKLLLWQVHRFDIPKAEDPDTSDIPELLAPFDEENTIKRAAILQAKMARIVLPHF